ncbi:hypothetical protein D3C72_2473510 [compost metagenome]
MAGAQLALFFQIADKRRFHQNRRNIRGLQYGKAGLIDTILMQTVNFTHPVQHFLTELQAVIDGGGLQ